MIQPLSKIIGATFLVQVAGFALGLGNHVLVSRWLGPANLGIVATLLMLADVTNKLTNLGQETAIVYFLGGRRFPRDAFLSTLAINGAAIYGVGALLLLGFVSLGGLEIFFEASELAVAATSAPWMLALLFAALIHEYGSKVWLALQEYRRYNLNLLFRPVIYLILIVLAYSIEALMVSAVLIVAALSLFLPGAWIWGRSILPLRLDWKREIAAASVSYGSRIMLANLLVFLIYRSDIFLLGYFRGQEEVGWYYVAVLVAERLHYLTHASSTVLISAASQSEAQREKTPILARTNLGIVFLGGLLVCGVAPVVLPLLFSEAYTSSVAPLLLLLPGIVAVTLPKVLFADLAARGETGYILVTNSVNFGVNLGLNLLLIPEYGIRGAAISSTISYTVAAVLIAVFYRRVSGFPLAEFTLPRRGDLSKLRNV